MLTLSLCRTSHLEQQLSNTLLLLLTASNDWAPVFFCTETSVTRGLSHVLHLTLLFGETVSLWSFRNRVFFLSAFKWISIHCLIPVPPYVTLDNLCEGSKGCVCVCLIQTTWRFDKADRGVYQCAILWRGNTRNLCCARKQRFVWLLCSLGPSQQSSVFQQLSKKTLICRVLLQADCAVGSAYILLCLYSVQGWGLHTCFPLVVYACARWVARVIDRGWVMGKIHCFQKGSSSLRCFDFTFAKLP